MAGWNDIFESDRGKTKGQYFIIGRVIEIVLDASDPGYNNPSDIGKIKYDMIYSTLSTSKANDVSRSAYPMFSFIKQFPLLNEIVLIMAGPTEALNDRKTRQQPYYFPPYSLWNRPNHGAFPNMDSWAEFVKNTNNKPGYQGSATDPVTLPLGNTFKEDKSVRNLKSFEGDIILQSRFGQSIRFGSTVKEQKSKNTWSNYGETGDPITIILNQQGSRKELGPLDFLVENVNRDGSSIYLTSNQEINIDLSGFPINSFLTKIKPINQNVVESVRLPLSNYGTSAQEQDKLSADYNEQANPISNAQSSTQTYSSIDVVGVADQNSNGSWTINLTAVDKNKTVVASSIYTEASYDSAKNSAIKALQEKVKDTKLKITSIKNNPY